MVCRPTLKETESRFEKQRWILPRLFVLFSMDMDWMGSGPEHAAMLAI